MIGGAEVSVAQVYEAARLCGLSLLASMIAAVGTLDRSDAVLKVPNGCTDLFVQVFGDAGRPARAAVGMGSLARNISVEVEAIALVRGV